MVKKKTTRAEEKVERLSLNEWVEKFAELEKQKPEHYDAAIVIAPKTQWLIEELTKEHGINTQFAVSRCGEEVDTYNALGLLIKITAHETGLSYRKITKRALILLKGLEGLVGVNYAGSKKF